MTDEVRTRSATGGEKGVKPIVFSQIPYEALKQKGLVYSYGAQKYNAHNFRKGYEWSKSFDAMMRHAFAFWSGEDLDPESGLPHMAHVGWHADVLVTFMAEHPDFDDRYKGNLPTVAEAMEAAALPNYAEAYKALGHEAMLPSTVAEYLLREQELPHDPMPPMPNPSEMWVDWTNPTTKARWLTRRDVFPPAGDVAQQAEYEGNRFLVMPEGDVVHLGLVENEFQPWEGS